MNDKTIYKIEEKIWDQKIINRYSSEIFTILNILTTSPEYINNIIIPNELEDEIQFIKKNEIQLYKQKININESFVKTYFTKLVQRFKKKVKKYAKYSIRRIKTEEEYRFYDQLKVKDFDKKVYFELDIDNFLPKTSENEIDFEKLIQKENKNKILSRTLSTITSIQDLTIYFKESFKEISSREFLSHGNVYNKEITMLFNDIAYELLMFFGTVSYQVIKKNENLKNVILNLKMFYSRGSDAEFFIYAKGMEELENNLNNVIKFHLDRMKLLNTDTKKNIFFEIMRIVLIGVKLGICFPKNFYSIYFRDATDRDYKEFGVKKVIDLHLFNEFGVVSGSAIESYGFVYEYNSFKKILKTTLKNSYLYEKYLNYLFE